MSKVAIVTDSNSGITQIEAKELGVSVIPMPFFINGQMYLEDINLTQEEFYKHLVEDSEISTSMPSPGECIDAWEKLLKEYDEIVFIPMSSGLSSFCQTATMLAEDYDGRIQVVNNQRISVTMRQSVLDAKQYVAQGRSAAEIKQLLEESKMESSIYITLDTLKYLKKGGRITPAAAAIGTILKLNPVLQIQGEKLDAYAKERGMKKARHTMIEAMQKEVQTRFKELYDNDNFKMCIAYSDVDDETLQGWVDEVKEAFPDKELLIRPLSLSIGCHIGPGALAIAGCRK